MKILDRYVLLMFVKNYLITFLVLVGMYIVLDMVFNFDEISHVEQAAGGVGATSILQVIWDICDFYFYKSFLIFVHMSAMIPVVAAAFTLMRLSRFNELSAFLASGVPLLRVALPIIIASVILNFLLIIDQAYVLPGMIPKLVRTHNDMHAVSTTAFPIQAMEDEEGALVCVGEYRPAATATAANIKFLDVIYRDEDRRPIGHLSADSAVWDQTAKQWKLTNGRLIKGLLRDDEKQTAEPRDIYRSNITPDEIALYRSSSFIELLSAERIDQLLAPQRNKSYGMLNLLRIKHWRFTQPFMNIVLLLLAIPAVLTREPGRLRSAATKCLTYSGVALAGMFIAYQLAGNRPPANWSIDTWSKVMAFLPIFIFLPLAVHLLDRLHKHGS